MTRVVDGYDETGDSTLYRTNSVYVRHADGTVAFYSFLKRGIPVKEGQGVKAGEQIGAVTPTRANVDRLPSVGFQFVVLRLDSELRGQPVEVRFAGPTPDGVVAEAGKSYGGR